MLSPPWWRSGLVFGGKSGGILKPDDARVIARGEAIYVAHCASCHGRNLEGQPEWKAQDKDGILPAPPHDESGHTWPHPDTLLFRITKLGVAEAANLKDYKTRMPAFGGILTHAEIIAALSYIKSRWPDDMLRKRRPATAGRRRPRAQPGTHALA
ncbi:cytochrome c [Mesorhizobium sp.]|uniref:c-type cytochrome n=1 Tax=Mesorhizobium sp. TaxID=1871066 RepID=UPI00257C570F|nr:cytochrome c [Mesorhizobium sp.]